MTINGRRSFCFNNRKYYVQNNPKLGRENVDDNYYLSEVMSDGKIVALYDSCGFMMPKFKTIKDAQRYVYQWDFMLKTL